MQSIRAVAGRKICYIWEMSDTMRCNADRSTVLTGATGFLGAFLMAGLLEQGRQLTVLGRPANGRRLSERLSELTRWFGIDPGDRLSPVEADFSRKHFGLDDITYGSLCAGTGRIIHCASDTSFSERNRTRVVEANVKGISPLLELVKDAEAEKLFYISSAYACGIHEGICMETPAGGEGFTNVYEESKARAENIIIRFCESIGMPCCILRPSIVFGHSGTGRSLKFNALYYAVKSLMIIRDIFIKDMMEHGGQRSGKWGFNLERDGVLHMSLSIRLRNRGSVNLIPVDFFVKTALDIFEDQRSEGVYHITNANPPDITVLMEYAERYLRIRGIRLVLEQPILNAEHNPAEELFDKFMEQYRPYLSDMRIFDRRRTDNVTHGFDAPPFTYDVFRRCMDYALENNWGRKDGFPR